jgi:CheY-like chemotaxis protein
MISGRPAKILLIDSNVYFAKRLGDALKKEGFDVQSSTQPAFALTTLEYDAPTAVVCATNMREMGALEIAKIIHADPKHAVLPIIALGDGSQRALMEAFQAGCEDYIDRARPPAVIATHIRNIIISKAEGFQPTQMLNQADTSLSGSLTHHDLPGVLQMLGHAHQTGALHINAGATDAILFFDAGKIIHAECGNLFGDEAVIHIIKSCVQGGHGVYKFVYGATSTQRTVLRNATDLMLDAMREYDESSRDSTDASASLTDSADSEPSLLHSLGESSADISEGNAETLATNPEEERDSFTLSPEGSPSLAREDSSATASTEQAEATESASSSAETDREPAPTEAQGFQTESQFPDAIAITTDSVDPIFSSSSADNSAVATGTIKRTDVLQAELANYPTTITERVLSDLRAHGDNPVDRALAELLTEQISGGNAHAQPQHSDCVGASQEQSPDQDQDQTPNQDHVHHSDNPDQEQP